jgi:glutamate racemase
MIGIIDSGLGGYTIYRALHAAYPEAAFLFLADQKNAPYGNKSAEDIIRIAERNIQWFVDQGIDQVVIACNTMNAVALTQLKLSYPRLTFYDVLEPTLQPLKQAKINKWLVVGTQLTIQSGLYEQAIHEKMPHLQVSSKALPQLVSMIENLASEDAIEAYLKTMIGSDLQAAEGLILACTHYPLAASGFRRLFDGQVLDSIQAMIDRLKEISLPIGISRCVTTKDAQFAELQVQQLFHETVEFSKVDIL